MDADHRLLEKLEEAEATARAGRKTATANSVGLCDWIPRISPSYQSPRHLARLATALEQAIVRAGGADTGTMQIISSVPPRHGKTETLVHAIAYGLQRRPELTFGFITYNDTLATSKSRKAMALAKRAGVRLVTENVNEWRTTEGGGCLSAGIMGTWTGHGVDVAIVDDPIKNRLEAESSVYRRRVWEQFGDAVCTRIEPGGTVVVNMCMTGDTPVTMSDGHRERLDELRVGDLVLSWEKGCRVIRRVLAYIPQGEDDVLELRTGNHRIRANARHPFLVSLPDGTTEWRRLGDIKKGDRLVASGLEPSRSESRISVSEAWLLGFMFGDGWVTINNKLNKKANGALSPTRSFVTCAALSKHDESNARVRFAFRDCFNVEPKETAFGYLRTEVARVGRWFLEHGLIGKAKTKRVPSWMFGQPIDVRSAFLEGFVEADGWIGKRERRTVTSCNRGLVSDIQAIVRGLGMSPTNITSQRHLAHPPHSPKPFIAEQHQIHWQPDIVNAPFRLATVRSVIGAGREQVFDVQIERSECFLADGLLSHNTRWHPDDLVGRLLADEGDKWTAIRMPAINERGEALWPERWPLSLLNERRARVGEYTWASLFQGEPRPRGGALFGDPRTYERLPTSGVLRSIGLDLAYSERTASDWSVCVVMLLHDGLAYVVDVIRKQLKAPEFKMHIRAAWLSHGRPALSWYAYGPEKGVGDFLRREPDPLPVRIEQASGDHFVRAQGFSAAWNRGAVLVPESAPWLDDFLAEVCSFTGVSDDHDDQVDAAVAAWDYLAPHAKERALEAAPEPGTPEWDRAQALEAKRHAAQGVERRKDPFAFGLKRPNFGGGF